MRRRTSRGDRLTGASHRFEDLGDESAFDLGRVLSGGQFDRAGALPASLMRRLPPAPRNQRALPGDEWRALRPYVTRWIIVSAVGMLVAVVVAVLTLGQIPVFRVSAWSLMRGLFVSVTEGHTRPADFYPSPREGGNGAGPGLPVRILLTVLTVLVAGWFIRRIPRFALWEEQAFRQGCERWTTRERLRSAHIFGWAHFLNMIYPIATVCALMLGGWIFTVCYLREYRRSRDPESATYSATALHSVYNVVAVALLAGGILTAIWI